MTPTEDDYDDDRGDYDDYDDHDDDSEWRTENEGRWARGRRQERRNDWDEFIRKRFGGRVRCC